MLRPRVLLLALLLVLLDIVLIGSFFAPLNKIIYGAEPLEGSFPLRVIQEHMLSLPLLVVWIVLMVAVLVPIIMLFDTLLK